MSTAHRVVGVGIKYGGMSTLERVHHQVPKQIKSISKDNYERGRNQQFVHPLLGDVKRSS
jgi:hypothetical protein